MHAQVTDSAGVGIVRSTPAGVYARVVSEPSLRIGALEGADAFLFERIVSVVRDADRNLVVTDGGPMEIRVFDNEGNHLRTLGGIGEGPGEFTWLDGAWTAMDGSIVAADGTPPATVARFGADGSVVGPTRFTGVSPSPIPFLRPLGLVGERFLLSSVAHVVLVDHREPFRAPVLFMLHGFDGVLVDTISRLPGRPATVLAAPNPGGGVGRRVGLPSLPMSAGPTAVGSADGIAITGGEAYEVRFLSPSGSLSRIARLAEAPPVRTDEHVERYVREMVNDMAKRFGDGFEEYFPGGKGKMVRERTDHYKSLPLLERLPGYVRLLFADTGELWALRYRLPGAPVHRWDVFGVDGRHLGTVDVPASLRLHGISHGQLFGVTRDELDVQYVEVRDLEFSQRRPRPPAPPSPAT